MKAMLDVDMSNPLEIKMTRVFNAPKRLVYRALTEPDLIKKWMGGSRSNVLDIQVDLRVGGSFKFVFGLEGGKSFFFTGIYQEVGEDRYVHTELFNGQPPGALVTTTLVEKDGKTTLVAIMHFESQEVRDMVAGTGMAEGAGESYDHLEKLLQTL